MTCPCCNDARDWPGTVAASTFSEGCLHCGARLIWSIQRLSIAKSEASARCTAVRLAWMARGHSEAGIRQLARQDEAPMESESSEKPRRRGG